MSRDLYTKLWLLIELCNVGCDVTYKLFQTHTLIESPKHCKQGTWVGNPEGAQDSQIVAMGN